MQKLIEENTRNKERLYILIDLIINNTDLSYDKTKLRIDDERAVIDYLKIIAPERYNERYNTLIENN